MQINRRRLLKNSIASAAGLSACAVTGHQAQGASEAEPAARRQRFGVSTYSFWRFRDDTKVSIEKCIDLASEMGFDGVEILHIQMESEDLNYLQRAKTPGICQWAGPLWLLDSSRICANRRYE